MEQKEVVVINFSDDRMTMSQLECSASALKHGATKIIQYDPKMIGNEFALFNPDIWGQSRGFSFWLWKPYIIYKTTLVLKDGDILIYADSGIKFINDLNHIIGVMTQDIFLFSNGHQHVHWCKMDVIAAINPHHGSDSMGFDPNGHYREMQQCQASVIFFKVNQNTRNFIKEWLLYCQMPGFIDDSPSKRPNHPEFAEHRHDQAILTCLAIKYGYTLHWWADALWYESQRYRWIEDTYPSMFEHHRKRDPGKGGGKDPEW